MDVKNIRDVGRRATIYISGKMTGLEDLGKGSMDSVEEGLREIGFLNIINPYYEVDQGAHFTWTEAMVIDIHQILVRDVKAMVLIEGWEESKGAYLEVLLFLALGIPIFNTEGWEITRNIAEELDPIHMHTMIGRMYKESHGG